MNRLVVFSALLLFSVLIAATSSSYATEKILSDMGHGVTVYADDEPTGKTIRVVVDEKLLLDNYQYWKDLHAVRSETTETYFRSHPYGLAASFALMSVAPFLSGFFAPFDGAPATKIKGSLIEPDSYGQAVEHQIFSFTFTKKMNDKINWEGFNAESFQTIAPDFHYTPWFVRKYHSEPLS